MKTLPYELNGHTFYLCLNGQALFDAYDKFGYEGFLTKHIEGKDKQSFENTCWLLAKLAEQGELVRRWQGLERGPIVPVEYFRAHLRPLDVAGAKDAMAKRSFASYATRSSAGRSMQSLQTGSMRGYQIGASRTTPLTARGILFYSPTPVIFLASGVSIPRWSCTE